MNFFLQSDIEEIIQLAYPELKYLASQRVLLAGGKGFLGRYFTEIIRQFNKTANDKIHLVSVDNFAFSTPDSKFDTKNTDILKFRSGDICDQSFVSSLGNFDVIINAAGIASPYYYRARPLETLDVSVKGSRNLLELAQANNAKFTFFSSSEIYGDPVPEKIPMQESYRGNVSTLGPRACYDESKRLGETLCYIYKQYFGIHTNIIRPFNIYGPGMQQEDYRVMPNFASNIKSNSNLKLYGSASQTRTYCYISDAMTGFFKVISRGLSGEPYNIGNPRPEISVTELADLFIRLSENQISKDIVDYPDSYPGDEPMRRCPDIKKAKLQLDFNPLVELEDGVSRFLKWTSNNYRKNA